MSQPERQASPGATAPAAPAVASLEMPPFALPAPGTDSRCGPIWEAIFQHVAPQERQELLGLARQQGVLYGHQLPPLTNGARAHADHARPSLTQLLQTPATQLKPNPPTTIEFRDTALDDSQKQAVALALSTPDLFLLSGTPGTGKTRVLAELVTQAVARGERVLLLSASPAPVDRLLEQVAGREGVWAVRCLGPNEATADLSPAARALTLAERVRQFREEPLARALEQRQHVEQRCRQREHDQLHLAQLGPLAQEAEHLEQEGQRLQQRRASLAREVTEAVAALETSVAASPALATAFEPWVRSHSQNLEILDSKTTAARAQVESCRQRKREHDDKLLALRPLVEARTRRHFWSAAWWRAMRQGDVAAQLHTLEQQREQTRKELHGLEDTIQSLTRQRQDALTRYAAERSERIHAEVQRLDDELSARQRELDHRQGQLVQQWQAVCEQVSAGCPRPALDRAALDAARVACGRLAEQDAQELAFLTQWIAGLHQLAPRADVHLPDYVNVVAATTAGLPRDPHFGRRMDFDLLVLQEAHAVTESELLTVGARARRWVLVGELPRNAAPAPAAPAPAKRPRHPPVVTSVLRIGVFDRLWQRLHGEPRQLPYAWTLDGGRLHCRLRAVAPEQRQWLEKESVADRPDIELCILTLPRSEPALAEVLFPPTMSIAQAKQYIYQEIQELAVAPAGPALSWSEDAEQVVVRFGKGRTAGAQAVILERGVREWISGPGGWLTEAITFERAAGWDRAQADQWLRHLLGLRDTGRAVHLEVPYRMRPALAAVVADLLGDDGCDVQALATVASVLASNGTHATEAPPENQPSCVRFLPVPPLPLEATPRRPSAGRPRLPRTGAGFELDLADARCRDRLPDHLRPHLPAQGLVNYLEAQAVLRTLEAWASHPAGELRAKVLVLALYPAQAQLIQLLLDQSPLLAASRPHIEVTVPTAYSEREAEVVLLSLTRSHGHRAVSFGTDPEQLTLALTRARGELVLFGDPGTLARRCHWDGPLDHLDAMTAARERALVERLVRLLEGRGPRREAFQVCEGAHA